jgi:GntR family transcriptional regulator
MKIVCKGITSAFQEVLFMTEFKDIYAKETHAQLIREMKSGAWANATQLPRESELAAIMGISRTQLRDILAVLECEGFITRRHGVGTLINRHVLNLPVRIDMELEFLDMIHAGGHTPSVAFVKSEESPATAEEAEKLQLQPGTVLLRCNKLCAADKKPAIYCEDMFDARLLREPVTDKSFRAPIFQLLQDNCRINCFMDVAQLKPIVADDRLAEILQIAPGTPLMYIEEVDFDVDGNPILFSRQYFVNDYFRYNIIRKRL